MRVRVMVKTRLAVVIGRPDYDQTTNLSSLIWCKHSHCQYQAQHSRPVTTPPTLHASTRSSLPLPTGLFLDVLWRPFGPDNNVGEG